MNPEEQLQDRLSRLEKGEPVETHTADLSAEEFELLEAVKTLRSIVYPTQTAESIAAQRAILLKTATHRLGAPLLPIRASLFPQGTWSRLTTWPKSIMVAAFGAAIMLIIAGLLLLRPGARAIPAIPVASTAEHYTQFVPIISSAPVTAAKDPDSAVVAEARGVVEMQTAAGQWQPISTGQALTAGQHVRTQNLSSAQLLFYDGSRTQLGPLTEIAIEALNAPASGPRTILLAQLSGSTEHQVTHSSDPDSRYEVHTPNGTGSAKGTRFQVFVSPELITRVAVEDGLVVVINVNVTVQVTAGHVTTINPGAPPTAPVFHVNGEGLVTQTGEVWRIGGLDFHTTNTTAIIGNPQPGDRVSVDGHLAPDGTRIADVIVLLSRAPQNRFEFTGRVEAIGSDHWTIAGRTVEVSQTTQIDPGIKVGDLVNTTGVINPAGALLANNIRLLTAAGLPFEFTGVVQQLSSTSWTISGITIAVTDTTKIDTGLQVGNLVTVQGHILPTGTWLATEIKRAPEFENRFEFSGIVQNMTPWMVAGLTFTTTEQTEIDAGIKIGDRVKVEGHILPDGTWLAEEIHLVADQALTFEFNGEVMHIDPWIVSGITFTVNSFTSIESGIVVGDRVRVTGIVQPDGSLLAQRIERVVEELGCTEIRVKIVAINGNQLVLSDGQTITLHDKIRIEGQLQVSAVVIIRLCIRADGAIVIVSISVIFTPAPALTPLPPPQPSEGERVTVCHKPGKNQHTLTIDRAALGAHLGHGDKLGPCNGGGGDDGDDQGEDEHH